MTLPLDPTGDANQMQTRAKLIQNVCIQYGVQTYGTLCANQIDSGYASVSGVVHIQRANQCTRNHEHNIAIPANP